MTATADPDQAAATAIIDSTGSHTYARLESAARATELAIRDATARTDLAGERVAIHVPPGLGYAAALLGTWRAGAIAVPLCLAHPEPELAYVLDDTRAFLVVTGSSDTAETPKRLAADRGAAHVDIDAVRARAAPDVGGSGWVDARELDRPALILYTSGTTGRPKGVVLSHANLAATVDGLVEAWAWTADDRIVHVLPLHHTHGIVNAFLCALQVGATVDMLPGFEAERTWESLSDDRTTLFMAVPTIYGRLIRAWEAADAPTRARWSDGASGLRLMVSGSAALPVPALERWKEITGHTLLERYGMTEIGMALSNPLRGERRPGSVGSPLPGVDIRLVDEEAEDVEAGEPGEIFVRGPAVFREYWERPDETVAAFSGGWFRTGDICVVEDGAHRLLGRRSVDIIKSGGYKVSALEIENVLGGHPDIRECAVVGVADPEWGEAVCAALVSSRALDRGDVREWARDRLAPYKLPQRVLRVPELPRNAMGKVTKPKVRELFGGG